MRTTIKEVEGVFRLWVAAINGRAAESYKDVGAYKLDYAACYGGYRVERICNEAGGVSDVTLSRAPAAEFVAGLRIAMRSIEQMRLNDRLGEVKS